MIKCLQILSIFIIFINFLYLSNAENGRKKELIIKTNLNVDKCIHYIQLDDRDNSTEKNWKCRIKNKKSLFCFCFYNYECNEFQKFFFSFNYNQHFWEVNRMNNIERGAEYQCENFLRNITKKYWICETKETQKIINFDDKSSKEDNQRFFCECMHKRMCTFNRLVDLD